MDKDELIAQLNAVRSALGTISIISTRQNMNALLGSMQTLDRVIFAMQMEQEERKENSEQQNQQ